MPIAEAVVLSGLSKPRRKGARRGGSRVVWPEPAVFEPHDAGGDRRALVELARWCHQFSPTVGLEESDSPDTLLLDATRLAPLYGGEEPLVRQVAQAFERRGFDVRLALGDTMGAAWALAHFGDCRGGAARHSEASGFGGDGRSRPHYREGYQQRLLAGLPLAALRLPGGMLATLAELGIDKISALLALPREQLRSRFGPLLLVRLDQALGRVGETFEPVEAPADFCVEHAFEYPVGRQDAIRHAVERLLERLAWLLSARNAGALRLRCRFECEGAAPVAVEFDLFQPTAAARHLLDILDLHLERLRLPAPATGIALRVLRQAPLGQRQSRLFEQERTLGSSRQLAGLVDRLAGRLGGESVVRCRLQSDAQPELAYREEPLVGSGRERRATSGRSLAVRAPAGGLDRPLCLLSRPVELDATSVAPDGPPAQFARGGEQHEVARWWGPERIETGWWRRSSVWRDYYRVETSEGRRYWLFRRRRDGRGFLHGAF
jgi:protein ImuB